MISLQDILDVWLTTQSKWLYLEPIFGNYDIIKKMPEETQCFTIVDEKWRKLVEICLQNKYALALVKIDNLLEKINESNTSLELILKVKI